MAVQDDRREVEVRDRIGLRGGETRSGVDAYFDFPMKVDAMPYPWS